MTLPVMLADMDESYLKTLVENKEREQKTIDYKKSLPKGSDDDKEEFRADVSSFANTSGGRIYYGIIEVQGEAREICGLGDIDADKEILRLESMAQSKIRPRIPGLAFHPILLGQGSHVIVVDMRRSWAGPHAVERNSRIRFWGRNSAGKFVWDIDQLRTGFTISQTLQERIREFRIDRLSRISSNDTPLPMRRDILSVLHVIPFSTFDTAPLLDMRSVRGGKRTTFGSGGYSSWRYNFDGVVEYSEGKENLCWSYRQLFRNGNIEVVDHKGLKSPRLFVDELEDAIIGQLKDALALLQSLGIDTPICVMLSLIGVKDFVLETRKTRYYHEPHPIDRNALLVYPEIVTSYEATPESTLQPVFDSIWNAGGFEASLNYDKLGNRI